MSTIAAIFVVRIIAVCVFASGLLLTFDWAATHETWEIGIKGPVWLLAGIAMWLVALVLSRLDRRRR